MLALSARMGIVAACLALTGCGLPRGAAFESEVLSAASKRAGASTAAADFVVEPVTRDALPRLGAWPLPGTERMAWIAATDDAPNRTIAPGDVLAVNVWSTEDNGLLTVPGQRSISLGEITVSAGGTVFMPYVGTIRVAGMSPERAREAIEAELTAVSPMAQVQLEMSEGRTSQVSLVGGVGSPGAYPLADQSFSILALLAEGGGVAPGLNNPQVRLIRGRDIYGTSVERLFSEPGLDATLRRGDRVVVEADDRYFLSLGAAGREAEHPFPRDEVTALEALSIIGGLSDARADPQGILVLRAYPPEMARRDGTGPGRTRVVFTLDLTSADGLFSADEFLIAPGDLVYATESPVTSAQTIMGLLGSALGLAARVQ